jgi:hypothetical protein
MSYPFIITGILGFILNTFSLAIFKNTAEFSIPLYKYLRIYCLNNIAVCLFGTCNCFFATKRVFPWSNSYYTNAYCTYFCIPVFSALNFFGSLIDIFILLDRIGNFNNRVKTWAKLPPVKTCTFSFIACIIFNLPFFIVYYPASKTVMLNATISFTIWYGGSRVSVDAQLEFVLFFIYLVIRDFGHMIVQLAMNIASIVLLVQYLERKKSRLRASAGVIHEPENNLNNNHGFNSSIVSVAELKATVRFI